MHVHSTSYSGMMTIWSTLMQISYFLFSSFTKFNWASKLYNAKRCIIHKLFKNVIGVIFWWAIRTHCMQPVADIVSILNLICQQTLSVHSDNSTRDSAHNFCVKFSPCMCAAIVASLTSIPSRAGKSLHQVVAYIKWSCHMRWKTKYHNPYLCCCSYYLRLIVR